MCSSDSVPPSLGLILPHDVALAKFDSRHGADKVPRALRMSEILSLTDPQLRAPTATSSGISQYCGCGEQAVSALHACGSTLPSGLLLGMDRFSPFPPSHLRLPCLPRSRHEPLKRHL